MQVTTRCRGAGSVGSGWRPGTGRVHDPQVTRVCGPDLVDELNRVRSRAFAAEHGRLSVERVRVHTTVVEADIKYPTDSGPSSESGESDRRVQCAVLKPPVWRSCSRIGRCRPGDHPTRDRCGAGFVAGPTKRKAEVLDDHRAAG